LTATNTFNLSITVLTFRESEHSWQLAQTKARRIRADVLQRLCGFMICLCSCSSDLAFAGNDVLGLACVVKLLTGFMCIVQGLTSKQIKRLQ